MRNHVVEVVNEIGVRLVALEHKMDKVVDILHRYLYTRQPLDNENDRARRDLSSLEFSTHVVEEEDEDDTV